MTAPTTDNRPTDTIRDAFEAMIAFLTILIGGPMPRAWPDIAAVAARAIGSQARTTEEADRAVAALASFRDLIQRAAEEHNRRAAAGAFTPERMREARERCAEIDRRYQAGLESDSNREDLALTVLAIRAAREDLPAALSEIERRATHAATWKALARRLMRRYRSERRGHDLTRSDRKKHRAEIERLTAELAARAPVDAPSLARARAVTRLLALGLDGQEVAHLLADAASIVAGRGRLTSPGALAILADYVAPADASLEARAEMAPIGDALARLGKHLETAHRCMNGVHVCDIEEQEEAIKAAVAAYAEIQTARARYADASDIGKRAYLALDAYRTTDSWLAVVRAVDASRPAAPEIDAEDLWTDYRTGRGTVFASDRKAFLAGVAAGRRTVDASRPGLTEEQAREIAAAVATSFNARWSIGLGQGPLKDLADRIEAGVLRASRGETGPATAGLTRAMRDAQQRPSEPPTFDDIARKMPGATCGEVIAALDARRATLHAGDPLRCPGPNCKMCNGEACNKCGAGCWNNAAPYCAHSVDERHEPAIYSTEEPSR